MEAVKRDPAPLTPAGDNITAGPNGPTLTDLRRALAYHPETGVFAWRDTVMRADAKQTGVRGDRSISYRGRPLAAHMVAWFFAYGQWPPRKAIRWFNKNHADNRRDNLYLELRHEPDWIRLDKVERQDPGGDETTIGGATGVTVGRIRKELSYDPKTGELSVLRTFKGGIEHWFPVTDHIPHRPGQIRYFTWMSRRWPAHAMIAFMHSGKWPPHKGVRWVNGVQDDNRIENLLVRSEDYAGV
jgi:ribosomal protein L15E